MFRKSIFGMNNNTKSYDYTPIYPFGLMMYYNNFLLQQKQKQIQNLQLIKNSPTKKQKLDFDNEEKHNNSSLIKLFEDNAL